MVEKTSEKVNQQLEAQQNLVKGLSALVGELEVEELEEDFTDM